MQSKPLKQLITLTLDTKGMQGPVTLRGVAEEVLSSAPDDYYSLADDREARLALIQGETKRQMRESLSEHDTDLISSTVPKKYRKTIARLPKFICVSARGGRGSQHVMSLVATEEDWNANYELKAYVTRRAGMSRDDARDIRDLLRMLGASSLKDIR